MNDIDSELYGIDDDGPERHGDEGTVMVPNLNYQLSQMIFCIVLSIHCQLQKTMVLTCTNKLFILLIN